MHPAHDFVLEPGLCRNGAHHQVQVAVAQMAVGLCLGHAHGLDFTPNGVGPAWHVGHRHADVKAGPRGHGTGGFACRLTHGPQALRIGQRLGQHHIHRIIPGQYLGQRVFQQVPVLRQVGAHGFHQHPELGRLGKQRGVSLNGLRGEGEIVAPHHLKTAELRTQTLAAQTQQGLYLGKGLQGHHSGVA